MKKSHRLAGWLVCAVCLLSLVAGLGALVSAQEATPAAKSGGAQLIASAWDARGKKDWESALRYTQACIDTYKEDADRQQSSLTAMPPQADMEKVQALNDVATAYFIQAEVYREQGNIGKALDSFRVIVNSYCCAQSWDARGWYWQVAKVAQEGIAQLKSDEPKELSGCKCKPIISSPKPSDSLGLATELILYDPGKEMMVDYEKYGEFKNRGTKDYAYVVKDQEGLSNAVGEGIFPNTTAVRWDPAFKRAQKDGRLQGSHWDFIHSPDLGAAFLKWAVAPEPQGVKLFYTGLILEKAGLIKQALKCYYAIVVHFPGSYGWTYWHTPWYVGQAAIAKINYLLRQHPEWGYKLEGADIRMVNGYDNDVSNDTAITDPGKFIKVGLLGKIKPRPQKDLISIKKRLGKGKVHLIQYETGDWELMVEQRPYTIQGVTYTPTKVGQSPDDGTMGNWMNEDFNANGRIDGPYDAFVDRNKNNLQDKDEDALGDFELMKEMGVNTIRLYHHPRKISTQILRDLYATYGIRVIMGDFLGKYALGSGADWQSGTDYNNPEHKKKMLDSVAKMVEEFKDEPFILFWLLGNENVYGYACNADSQPEAFFKFANEAARLIKTLDSEHPVAICSGDVLYLDTYGTYAPEIDIFGTNAYRGAQGFGRLWQGAKEEAGRPAFITEFGCSAYAEGRSADEAEELQAEYHRGSWEDIENNMAFAGGAGNSLGGVVFEWLDEWWKGYEPGIHDTKGLWVGPFPDGYMHEEWLGLCGQGEGNKSPYLRRLRKSYYMYKKLWK